jgi:hypothetical protein
VGYSKARATPWRGLMAARLDDGCGSSMHHGGTARRRSDFSRDHDDTTPQAARAPPRQWGVGAGVGSTKVVAARSDDGGLGSGPNGLRSRLRSFFIFKN